MLSCFPTHVAQVATVSTFIATIRHWLLRFFVICERHACHTALICSTIIINFSVAMHFFCRSVLWMCVIFSGAAILYSNNPLPWLWEVDNHYFLHTSRLRQYRIYSPIPHEIHIKQRELSNRCARLFSETIKRQHALISRQLSRYS